MYDYIADFEVSSLHMPSPKSNDYNGEINNTTSENFYFIIGDLILTSPR